MDKEVVGAAVAERRIFFSVIIQYRYKRADRLFRGQLRIFIECCQSVATSDFQGSQTA